MTSPVRIQSVRQIWHQALGPIARDVPAILAAFADVERRYAEPARHYHTLDHVWHVLRVAFQLSHPAPVTAAHDLAAVLHDVIYDPRAKDNEERSTDYAHEVLASLGVERPMREEVARLILLTRKHETTPDDRIGQILLDADLSVLGADEAEYDAYAAAIRREYSWVSDDDYRTGRRGVLQRFLGRPQLFHVPMMRTNVEPRARANLAREIASLGG